MITKFFITKGLLVLLFVAFMQTVSYAQSNDTTDAKILTGVVVTGQYSPRKAEDAVQRIRVIDAKKIAAMGAQNLRDVLLNEMNVSIAQDNVLGSSVSIQGVKGQNVKILIDGVPVIGRQEGNVDISQMNVYNVERIELVEGPMSVNFGTDALAGTINIITKSSIRKKLEAGINTYTETIGKYNANANVGFSKNQHTLIVSGSRNFFSGWDPKQGFNYLNFEPTLADSRRDISWDTKEEYNANLQYSYKYKRINFRFKSDYFYDIITNRGAPSGFYGYSAFDDTYKTTRFNNAVFVNGKVFKSKNFSFLAAYNQYKRDKNTYIVDLTTMDRALGAGSDQDTSKYSLFNSRGTFSNSNYNAQLNYELGYDINIENGTGKRILNKEQQIGDYAVYISTEYKIVKDFVARVGLRYAYNTAFNAPIVPSLNLKYTLMKNLTLRGSYARGFRAPTVKELYFEFKDSNHDIIGNPNLTPEKSDNFNVAANYTFKVNAVQYKLEASGFYNSIDNMITLAGPDSIMRYTYLNIDFYKTKGLQLNITGQYKNLSIVLGGSYIGRYNRLPEMENATPPAYFYSPEFRCNANYEWTKYKTIFSAFVKHTGPMPGIGADTHGNPILLPIQAYTLADVSVTKKLMKDKISLILGCKNLFNVGNVNFSGGAAGGSGGAHTASSSSISVGTGRSAFFGVGYQFSK